MSVAGARKKILSDEREREREAGREERGCIDPSLHNRCLFHLGIYYGKQLGAGRRLLARSRVYLV